MIFKKKCGCKVVMIHTCFWLSQCSTEFYLYLINVKLFSRPQVPFFKQEIALCSHAFQALLSFNKLFTHLYKIVIVILNFLPKPVLNTSLLRITANVHLLSALAFLTHCSLKIYLSFSEKIQCLLLHEAAYLFVSFLSLYLDVFEILRKDQRVSYKTYTFRANQL